VVKKMETVFRIFVDDYMKIVEAIQPFIEASKRWMAS
jgi:hypothetical protein